ncbi:spore germination protein [Metabacillus arenae]|uniref:Spore germination protein n=1 Tax=Metabacillus arenae TaxID=2771434 RepID=A0A926NF75_9BACI|nr:spore germination protein [Metabacillus arenae]MBD1379393.1 spore germination protein [Metabacillus arenae]
MTTNDTTISTNLSENQKRLEDIFSNCEDLKVFPWQYGPDLKHKAFSVYFTTLVQEKSVNYMKKSMQDLVPHEVGPATTISTKEVINFFNQNGISSENAVLVDRFNQAVSNILQGYIVIFFDGWDKVLSYSQAEQINMRNVTEPVSESVVKGPREGTVEQMKRNIGLLRNRLQNPNFKIEKFRAGGATRTEVAFGYLEGTVDKETLAEFKKRIDSAKQGDILETANIEELIEDSTYSPFPQYRTTERPDVAISSLLEGRIIVMVQGTGTILICPGLFTEFFQASEDYYHRVIFSSFIRVLRMAAFFMALTLPSAFIALTTFHPELIPTNLLMAILDTREGLPFPAFLEVLIMIFFFELLREAGIRLPRPVGSAVSIVGALIVGEAAINANIASPAIVILVALTGIASFAMPHYSIAIGIRLLQLPLMILAAVLGGFGIMIGFVLIMLHLTYLRSLGQPYFSPLTPFRPRQLLDVLIRAPLKSLWNSPRRSDLQSKSPKKVW